MEIQTCSTCRWSTLNYSHTYSVLPVSMGPLRCLNRESWRYEGAVMEAVGVQLWDSCDEWEEDYERCIG